MSLARAPVDAPRCESCFEPAPAAAPAAAGCVHCGFDGSPEPGSEDALPPGTHLRDDFVLGRTLGQGGFGITYLAWDVRLGRRRAIKEYFPRGIATRGPDGVQVSVLPGRTERYAAGMQRYLDEARLLAQFESHECIVAPLTFFELHGSAYLAMELLEGETLRSYVTRQGGRIRFDHAVHFLRPVIDALRVIHAAGITHRDVTPDNVFLTVHGRTKLIDFGAARQELAAYGSHVTVIVREHYAPPEQYSRSGRQGPWTDVYALCSTFYFALTGQPPPPAMDRFERDELVPPRELGADLPGPAESALLQGLALRPSQRLELDDLAHALLDPPAVEPAQERTERRLAGRELEEDEPPFPSRRAREQAEREPDVPRREALEPPHLVRGQPASRGDGVESTARRHEDDSPASPSTRLLSEHARERRSARRATLLVAGLLCLAVPGVLWGTGRLTPPPIPGTLEALQDVGLAEGLARLRAWVEARFGSALPIPQTGVPRIPLPLLEPCEADPATPASGVRPWAPATGDPSLAGCSGPAPAASTR